MSHATAKFDVEVKPHWWPGASPEMAGDVVAEIIRRLATMSVFFDRTTIRVTVFYGRRLREQLLDPSANSTSPVSPLIDPEKIADFLEHEVESIVTEVHERHRVIDKKKAKKLEEI